MVMLMNLIVKKFSHLQRRSVVQRKRSGLQKNEVLKLRLLSWCNETHKHDPLAAVRPPTFILDDKGIKTLAKIHPTEIRNSAQVVHALHETAEWDQEWSKDIIAIIQAYDNELKGARKAASTQQKAQQKRQRTDLDQAKFQEESDRIQAETERRIRESALQQSSRFSNTTDV